MWRAAYELPLRDRKVPYEVDVVSLECPIARISEESLRWIRDFSRAKRVHGAAGGVLYGPDSARWPARWFDAVDVIEIEVQKAEAAMHDAVRNIRER